MTTESPNPPPKNPPFSPESGATDAGDREALRPHVTLGVVRLALTGGPVFTDAVNQLLKAYCDESVPTYQRLPDPRPEVRPAAPDVRQGTWTCPGCKDEVTRDTKHVHTPEDEVWHWDCRYEPHGDVKPHLQVLAENYAAEWGFCGDRRKRAIAAPLLHEVNDRLSGRREGSVALAWAVAESQTERGPYLGRGVLERRELGASYLASDVERRCRLCASNLPLRRMRRDAGGPRDPYPQRLRYCSSCQPGTAEEKLIDKDILAVLADLDVALAWNQDTDRQARVEQSVRVRFYPESSRSAGEAWETSE